MSSTSQLHADVLLVTVTPVETQAVLDALREGFDRGFERRFIGDKTYHDLGEIGGARVFLVQSEMGTSGPGGSTLTVEAGIQALSPSAIVMVGIAFGVDPHKQRIGDILVARQLLLYELQRVGTGSGGSLAVRARGDRPSASTRLFDRFASGRIGWSKPNVQIGLLFSGEKLIDNQGFLDQLRVIEPEAIGGEMEGAGLYSAAQRHKVDWILVKAITDWADGKKGRNKRQRQALAASGAARFVLHVLQQGGFAEPKLPASADSVAPRPPQATDSPSPSGSAKYNVQIQNAQGTVVGDGAQVTMNFSGKPSE